MSDRFRSGQGVGLAESLFVVQAEVDRLGDIGGRNGLETSFPLTNDREKGEMAKVAGDKGEFR